jgi:hypothetical protein
MQSIERAVVVLAASALAGLALVAAGCGSDSPSSGVAQAPTTSTATQPSEGGDSNRGDGVAFAACMRSHGVSDFPDPKVTSEGEIISIPDNDSPQVRSALESCESLLPDGGVSSPAQQAQEQAQLLEFAACMRARGVPNFPDPTVSGGRVTLRLDGIDRSSPRFAAAKKACRRSLPEVTGG